MENREKQLQELKKEYQDIHMSEEQLLQMKQKISQAKQENSRQGSNAAHSSVSHRRSIARRCGQWLAPLLLPLPLWSSYRTPPLPLPTQ